MARKKGEGSFSKDGPYHVWAKSLGLDPVTNKRRRKVLKNLDLRELKKEVRQYLRDAEDGVPSTQGNARTGDHWADEWLENVRLNRARKTHKSYADTWRIWMRPRLGKKLLEQIGTSDIQACVNDARKQGHDATARYILVVAKTMLAAARSNKPPYIKDDPCNGVLVPGKKPPRERILSHTEANEILEELYRWIDYKTREGGEFAYPYRHLIRFMLETGARESEALGLQEFMIDLRGEPPTCRIAAQLDVDEDGKTYIKPYTKGKNIRTVPLSTAAVESIKGHRLLVASYRARAKDAYDEWALVFPSEEGTPIGWRNLIRQVDALREAVNAARVASGEEPMERWTPHDLRRTFGTRIAQTGATLKVTQTLLGHADPATTAKIYIVAERDELNAAVANMINQKKA